MFDLDLLKKILHRIIEKPEDTIKYKRVNKLFYELCEVVCCKKFIFIMKERISTYKHILKLPIYVHKRIKYVNVELQHSILPEGTNHTIVYVDCY